MYYPMPEHGIYQLCIRRTPLSVLGTSGGPYWAQALVSPRMSLNTFLSQDAILKNMIIRSKYDTSARHNYIPTEDRSSICANDISF